VPELDATDRGVVRKGLQPIRLGGDPPVGRYERAVLISAIFSPLEWVYKLEEIRILRARYFEESPPQTLESIEWNVVLHGRQTGGSLRASGDGVRGGPLDTVWCPRLRR
jgi:hypothetical protein